MKINYKCTDCNATWTTAQKIVDYCPKCLKNTVKIVSRSGGKSAYDLSN